MTETCVDMKVAGCDAGTEASGARLRICAGWWVTAGAYGRFALVASVPLQRLRSGVADELLVEAESFSTE